MANEDGLFLLEVLVDKVTFKKSPCFSDKDFRTCIKIECPAVQPLEICDDDPGSCIAKSGGPFIKTFNVGKSCLFSLKQADINKAMGSFPIKVTAYKSLPCGCIPAVIVLGEATIDMTKEFIGARNKYLANPTGVSYESLQDKFRLTASDGEAGDVALFLRISCFGKMIITKFQGASGPPSLGAGVGSVEVDRSCNAPREFQTPSAPCVCGASKVAAAKGKGNDCNAPCKNTHIVNQAICPPAVDPFNIQPCVEDPKTKKQDVPCRPGGGAQVAKDVLSKLWSMEEDQKSILEISGKKMSPILEAYYVNTTNETPSSISFEDLSSENSVQTVSIPQESMLTNCNVSDLVYSSLIMTFDPPPYESCLLDTQSNMDRSTLSNFSNNMFSVKETVVYVTLCDNFCHRRNSGTQATASVNKCLQVLPSSFNASNQRNDDYSTLHIKPPRTLRSLHSSDGLRNPKIFLAKTECCPATPSPKKSADVIPCPNAVNGLGDMFATVSHVQIGPKSCCPIAGTNPCKGPKCVQVTKEAAQVGKVKVTSSNNPRRGVFELVIRRINGAALARNELMVEWTPPPPPTCPTCSPCSRPPCGPPPKCPTIVCRATACKPSSCWKKVCGVPCRPCKRCNKTTSARNQCRYCCTPCPPPKNPKSCRPCPPCKPCPPGPCRPCSPGPCSPCRPPRCSPCRPPRCKPCRPCGPCPPPRCRPCRPKPCRRCPKKCKPRKPCPSCRPCCPPRPCKPASSCCSPTCNPCGPCPIQPCCPISGSCSAPCFRPCPVGFKKPRCRSRSHSRPRAHRKKVSPCLNRSKACGSPCASCPPSPCCPPRSCCPPRRCRPVCNSPAGCSNLLCPPRPTDVVFVSPPAKRCC